MTAVPNWGLGLLPVVHALGAVGTCCGSYDLPMIIGGIGGALMEIGGIVLAVIGAIGDEPSGSDADHVEVLPGAAGADVGLSVRLFL